MVFDDPVNEVGATRAGEFVNGDFVKGAVAAEGGEERVLVKHCRELFRVGF